MKHVNNFSGGIDSDSSPLAQKNTNYINAENLRFIVDETESTGKLSSGKGLQYSIKAVGSDFNSYKIVRGVIVGDYLTLFVQQISSTNGYIFKIPASSLTNSFDVLKEPYFSNYKLAQTAFNFQDDLSVVAKIETESIGNVYFTDSVNPLRSINIYSSPSIYNGKQASYFNLIRNTVLTDFRSPLYISGVLKSGAYAYSYALYTKGRGQTTFSSYYYTIPIFTHNYTTTNFSNELIAGKSGEVTNKGIKFSVDITNQQLQDFDSIIVVAVYYTDNVNVPEVRAIYDGAIAVTGNVMTFQDNGGTSLYTITYEELTKEFISLSPSLLETKNGYLFLGKIKEELFDYDGDWNPRAVRFIQNSSSNYTNINEYNNPFNNLDNDDNVLYSYKCKPNSTTLGGWGNNIEYEFPFDNLLFSRYPNNAYLKNPNLVTGYNQNCYLDPYSDASSSTPSSYSKIGFQRDEIYRFGIVFYKSNGQRSFVKWIDDVRFPNWQDRAIVNDYDKVNNRVNCSVLNIIFTLKDTSILIADGITHYQIVRAERDLDNSTVLDCGYISHLMLNADGDLQFGNPSTAISNTSQRLIQCPLIFWNQDTDIPVDSAAMGPANIVDYICGETVFNGNNTGNIGSRLDMTLAVKEKFPVNNFGGDLNNEFTMFSKLYPNPINQDYRVKLKINNLFKFNYNSDLNGKQTAPFSQGSWNGRIKNNTFTGNNGLKGTTIILKLDSSVYSSTTDRYPLYSARRASREIYGGFNLNAINNTNYVACSNVTPIAQTEVLCWGDTFISPFEYNHTIFPNNGLDGDSSSHIIQGIVESRINFWFTGNPRFSTYWDGLVKNSSQWVSLTYIAMHEKAGSYKFANDNDWVQTYDMYQFNPVYSANLVRKYFNVKNPLLNNETVFNTRVYKSEKKINGELIDSWSKVYANNFIDVDSSYGELSRLKNFNNTLYYFQPRAIGVLPVEDREVVQSNNTSSLVVGTGGVLSRYDYITTSSGTSNGRSVCGSRDYMYYIDDVNTKVCRTNGGNIEFISDSGCISYINNLSIDKDKLASVYNPKINEVWFYFGEKTIIYNEYTKSFIGSLPYVAFIDSLHYNGNTYIISSGEGSDAAPSKLCSSIYAVDKGKYGAYTTLGSDTIQALNSNIEWTAPLLEYMVSPGGTNSNRFDVIDLYTVLNDGDNLANKDIAKTFDTAFISNSYQSKQLDLTTDAVRRFRFWRINTLRDSYDKRMFDKYMKVALSCSNSDMQYDKFTINDITTEFTQMSYR